MACDGVSSKGEREKKKKSEKKKRKRERERERERERFCVCTEADANKLIIGMTRRNKRQIHLDLYFSYADK